MNKSPKMLLDWPIIFNMMIGLKIIIIITLEYKDKVKKMPDHEFKQMILAIMVQLL